LSGAVSADSVLAGLRGVNARERTSFGRRPEAFSQWLEHSELCSYEIPSILWFYYSSS